MQGRIAKGTVRMNEASVPPEEYEGTGAKGHTPGSWSELARFLEDAQTIDSKLVTRKITVQSPNRSAARALAFAASSSRFFGGAFVSSDRSSRIETPAISSMAP